MKRKDREALFHGAHATGEQRKPPRHYVGFHRPEVITSRDDTPVFVENLAIRLEWHAGRTWHSVDMHA